MRTVRFSITANDQLNELLAQGARHYSPATITQKEERVYDTIRRHLAHFPAAHVMDPDLGLRLFPVAKTPFVLAYDFDEHELRIHFVLHKSADRIRLDPNDVQW